jgi:L-galactose dehydrogenase
MCPQIVNETIPVLQKIKESGKARFIGITGLPLSIYTYVLDQVPPGSVDVILSYCHYGINDTALVDLLPYLKSKGVGVISASPLAMGLLTDNGPPEWHPAPKELKLACRAAADHCKKKGKNITKLAMQYSLMNNEISTVLVGMNSPEQVFSSLLVFYLVPPTQHIEYHFHESPRSPELVVTCQK